MEHRASAADREFRKQIESCEIGPAEFGHRSHVRLAYVYLTESGTEEAFLRMREAIRAFLECNGVEPTKYHETITRAWILAVRHFMAKSPVARSADAFLDGNPMLLDSRIMLTHYSAKLLFSDAARAGFIDPDLDPIPRHDP